MSIKQYENQIYAGVLGKILGVYLGRPVEGWSYQKIQDTFGEVSYYVHNKVGVPLIVADDDISGTFAFFRAIADNGFKKETTAEEFGRTWLNYIIENKTILWWGGLGRSTEHTAFLNLKNGIEAPMSGSIAVNGKTLAEQIGAQIFIDAIAMACPNDPKTAVKLVRAAASVSHDGLAVDAACHLAALEALAFEEKDIDVLLDKASAYIENEKLKAIIADVRDICSKEKDWRKVRAYLDPKYGYEVYPGCCHMVPNHVMVIASIILGGDDFQKSITIASSAAWDTDCNAGNVGALNGIRLGIEGINAGADFRGPVSDSMYVVTSDGGSVVTDAVLETKKIAFTAAKMAGEEYIPSKERYTFEYPGSTQGFLKCEYHTLDAADVRILNENEISGENGLRVECVHVAKGVTGNVATQVFIDFSKLAQNFSTMASPTLYSSQVVHTEISLEEKSKDRKDIRVRPYILYYDIDNVVQVKYGEEWQIGKEKQEFIWQIPDTKGMSIFKLGYQILSDARFDGAVILHKIDWNGAPTDFAQRGMLMNSIWNTNPLWLAGFASSAVQFAADFKRTYCVSNVEDDGVVTIGSKEWKDYSVESKLYFSLHKEGGMVLRSVGHRRFYAALLGGWKKAQIILVKDREKKVLGEVDYSYVEDEGYRLKFSAYQNILRLDVNGETILEVKDDTYTEGGAGFMISGGTMTCDSFIVAGGEDR